MNSKRSLLMLAFILHFRMIVYFLIVMQLCAYLHHMFGTALICDEIAAECAAIDHIDRYRTLTFSKRFQMKIPANQRQRNTNLLKISLSILMVLPMKHRPQRLHHHHHHQSSAMN